MPIWTKEVMTTGMSKVLRRFGPGSSGWVLVLLETSRSSILKAKMRHPGRMKHCASLVTQATSIGRQRDQQQQLVAEILEVHKDWQVMDRYLMPITLVFLVEGRFPKVLAVVISFRDTWQKIDLFICQACKKIIQFPIALLVLMTQFLPA